MSSNDFMVDLRLSRAGEGQAKAYADVTILLGADGMIALHGFAVLHPDGDSPRVVPPARKGKNDRYFDIVSLTGKARHLVESAILKEYAARLKSVEV